MTVRARLTVVNHRGKPVPAVLGLWLAAWGVAGLSWAWAGGTPAGQLSRAAWVSAAAAGLVFVAGLTDDLAGSSARGLRGHLHSLAGGRPTTGMLKVLVAVAAAAATVSAIDSAGTLTRAAGIVLVAGTTNVWNGLDVKPGRALKWFLLAGAGALAAGAGWGSLPIFPAVWVGAALVLVPDLREWAMLGDAGSTLIGFVAGVAAYLVLPPWGIVAAAAMAVALNVLADTVTLSRCIDAAPPLRWFDRVGTRPTDPGPEKDGPSRELPT